MRARSRRGFTLLEALIVVAILAIGAGIAFFSIQRSRESVSIERAVSQVRTAIEDARSLAVLAGARAGTPRLIAGTGCANSGANESVVTIDPNAGTVNFPTEIESVDATGTLTIGCETWTLAQRVDPGSGASFVSPAAVTTFSFAPTGRLVLPTGSLATSILVRITSPTQPTINGFRILSSGVICQSSDPNPPPGGECDESANW